MAFLPNTLVNPLGEYIEPIIGGTAWKTEALLANGASVSTGWILKGNYAAALYVIQSSHVGSIAAIEYSNDGVTSTSSGTPRSYTDVGFLLQVAFVPKSKYFRITFTNNSGATQTDFYFEVMLSTSVFQNTMASVFQNLTKTNLASITTGTLQAPDAAATFDKIQRTGNSLNVNLTNTSVPVAAAQKATYRASTNALFTPAVTATTPFFTINGSASKTIKIQSIIVSGLTLTAVAYLNIGLRKFSTAHVGGTSTVVANVSMDTNNAVGSATVRAYTAALTTVGTTVGDVSSRRILGQSTTAAAAGIPQVVDFDFSPIGDGQPLVLRGAAESIGLYWITAPASAVSMLIRIEWTEE